jgi:NAD(P)-dependent dehydrogenase (short-subunit alcohol dehydrogenase family)
MDMTCQDRVALVTGAAGGGMGRSIALTLAREGAAVVVNYRNSRESAAAIVAQIESAGGRAAAVQADVFTADGCRALVEAAVDRFGRVDICIVGPGGGWHPEPADRLDPAAALDDLHAEVAPLLYLLPLVLPGMYERGWGRLVGLGLHPTALTPAYAYNAAKAARVEALLRVRDQAWAHGVTVNIIAPGPVAAIEGLERAVEQSAHGPAWQARANVSPQDIAEGVAFMCSEAGRFITGCVLPYAFRG